MLANDHSAVPKPKYSVLLVDDSEDDRLFLRMAILGHSRMFIAGEVSDGESAVEYLEGQGCYQDRKKYPFPDAVLLDLKMPRKTGLEVLEWLGEKDFNELFVAIVSGSYLPEDVARSKALGAHAYFKKNPLREDLNAMLQELTNSLDNFTHSSPSQ